MRRARDVVAGEEPGENLAERASLVWIKRADEVLKAAEAGGVDASDHDPTLVGQADPLHAPVLDVLVALHEAAGDQVLDEPAGGGQGEADGLGALLEGQLAGDVEEVMEQLDLAERQVDRADRLEQVGRAVLMQVRDQRIEVGGKRPVGGREGGGWSGGGGLGCCQSSCLHARKYCKCGSEIGGRPGRSRRRGRGTGELGGERRAGKGVGAEVRRTWVVGGPYVPASDPGSRLGAPRVGSARG